MPKPTRTRPSLLVAVLTLVGTLIGSAAPALADHTIIIDFEPLEPVEGEGGEEEIPTFWDTLIDVRDDAERVIPVRGFFGQGIQVEIPAGTFRGMGALALYDPAPDEAWFRYHLRLDQWEATGSGKLPGPAGLYGSSARGCIPSVEGNPGWSARTMFAATGSEGADPGKVRLGTYLYHLGQAGDCGDELLWQPGIIEQDRWYCIEGHVKMNTPGFEDGLVEAWVDGAPALRWPDVAFRRADETTVAIRHMWLNIYFGGTFTNPEDLLSSLDEVVVSHDGRVPCPQPFLDDDGHPHEADLAELHAHSVLFGCGFRTACPDQWLTRAEMAALLVRAQGYPAGPDAFGDDGGHWAEPSINALAEAGITKGCNPPVNDLYCPDATLTRGEMAVFLERVFDLAPGPDAFDDDDGHFAEEAINAVAAAGITKGCDGGGFCPNDPLPRGQAATLLRRALGFSLPPDTVDLAGGILGERVEGTFSEDPEPDLASVGE